MQHNIKPIAANLDIPLKGWHTLRHSYTTLLRQNGNNPKVVQDLLRHATYSITANVYDAAVSDEKRKAHRGVLHLVTRTQTRTGNNQELLQVPDFVGVPDGTTLNRFRLMRSLLYHTYNRLFPGRGGGRHRGQEALDDICRNSTNHLIPGSKKIRTSMMMATSQHSKHHWGYRPYPPHWSVVGIHAGLTTVRATRDHAEPKCVQ